MLKPHHRVYVIAFMLDFSMMAANTALPFYVFRRFGGPAMSGTISGVEFGLYALACLLSSRYVSKSKNGLRWALVGLAGYTVLFPLSPLVNNACFFGAMVTLGLASMALVWPAVQSWLGGEADPKVRNRRLSFFNIAWTSGLAFGALAGGKLYDMNAWYPFLLVLVLGTVAWILIAGLPHERRYHREPAQEQAESASPPGVSIAYLYTAWVANAIGCGLVGSSRAVFSKRVDDLIEAGSLVFFGERPIEIEAATLFAWLPFVLCVSRAFTFIYMGKSGAWRDRFLFLAGCQIVAAGAFWILGFTNNLMVMLVCFAMVGVNAGASYFASLHYTLKDPKLKHGRAAVHESMVGIGNLVGCTAFGLLAARYGTAWPFLFTPVFVFLALVFQGVLLQYVRHREAHRAQMTA